MLDLEQEIEGVVDDIEVLDGMIDDALDDPAGNNLFLRACTVVRHHRRSLLAELESIAS